jgi:hypothetical protein
VSVITPSTRQSLRFGTRPPVATPRIAAKQSRSVLSEHNVLLARTVGQVRRCKRACAGRGDGHGIIVRAAAAAAAAATAGSSSSSQEARRLRQQLLLRTTSGSGGEMRLLLGPLHLLRPLPRRRQWLLPTRPASSAGRRRRRSRGIHIHRLQGAPPHISKVP